MIQLHHRVRVLFILIINHGHTRRFIDVYVAVALQLHGLRWTVELLQVNLYFLLISVVAIGAISFIASSLVLLHLGVLILYWIKVIALLGPRLLSDRNCFHLIDHRFAAGGFLSAGLEEFADGGAEDAAE